MEDYNSQRDLKTQVLRVKDLFYAPFSDQTTLPKRLQDYIQEIREGLFDPQSFPPLKVTQMHGKYYTTDHQILYVLQSANVNRATCEIHNFRLFDHRVQQPVESWLSLKKIQPKSSVKQSDPFASASNDFSNLVVEWRPNEKAPNLPALKKVPSSFKDENEFNQIFLPLVIQETFAAIQQDWEKSNRTSSDQTPKDRYPTIRQLLSFSDITEQNTFLVVHLKHGSGRLYENDFVSLDFNGTTIFGVIITDNTAGISVKVSKTHTHFLFGNRDKFDRILTYAITTLTSSQRIYASVQVSSRYKFPVLSWKPNPKYNDVAHLSGASHNIISECYQFKPQSSKNQKPRDIISQNYDVPLIFKKFIDLLDSDDLEYTMEHEFCPSSWLAPDHYKCFFVINGVQFPLVEDAPSLQKAREQAALLAAVEISGVRLLSNIQLTSQNARIIPQLDPQIDRQLNRSQSRAIQRILDDTELITLVQGPPGTGKTTTISYALSAFYKNGSRILITAPSNEAVNILITHFLTNFPNVPFSELLLVGAEKNIDLDGVLEEIFLDSKIRRLTHALGALLRLIENALKATNISNLRQSINQVRELSADVHLPQTVDFRWHQIVSTALSVIEIALHEKNRQNFLHRDEAEILREIQGDLETKISKKFYDKFFHAVEKELVANSQFIFCTLSSAGRAVIRKHSGEFEAGVIDEASQCTEPEANLLLLCKVKKLILVGDPKQLGPTVISDDVARCGYDVSLMKRLMGLSYTHSLLDTQYRMDPLIAQWPSKRFYNNKLKNGKNVLLYRQLVKPLVFFNTTGAESMSGQSYYNKSEIECVVHIFNTLIELGIEGRTIGIISFYQSQVSRLKNALGHRGHAKIATVDGFQGQEREIIILSFVRCNDAGNMGFIKDQRLNVSMTRAKHSLLLVGNIPTMQRDLTTSLVKAVPSDCVWDYSSDLKLRELLVLNPSKIPPVPTPQSHSPQRFQPHTRARSPVSHDSSDPTRSEPKQTPFVSRWAPMVGMDSYSDISDDSDSSSDDFIPCFDLPGHSARFQTYPVPYPLPGYPYPPGCLPPHPACGLHHHT